MTPEPNDPVPHEHHDLETRILAWLDGELPPHQADRLQQQLRDDPRAAKLLDQHRSLQAALNEHFGRSPAFEDADQRRAILNQLPASTLRRRLRFRPVLAGATAAAACVLAVGAAWLWLDVADKASDQAPPPPGPQPAVVTRLHVPATPRAGIAQMTVHRQPPRNAPPPDHEGTIVAVTVPDEKPSAPLPLPPYLSFLPIDWTNG